MKKILLVAFLITIISLLIPSVRFKIYSTVFYKHYEINLCKVSFYNEKNAFANINDELTNEYGASEKYLSMKSASQFGMSYLLLVNYPSKSIFLTYFTNGGLKSRLLDSQEGQKLFSSLVGSKYKKVESEYGDSGFNPSCSFVRINDSHDRYDFEMLNGGENISSPSIDIVNNVTNLLNVEYETYYKDVNNRIHQETVELVEYSEKEHEKFNKLLDKDIFYELKALNK